MKEIVTFFLLNVFLHMETIYLQTLNIFNGLHFIWTKIKGSRYFAPLQLSLKQDQSYEKLRFHFFILIQYV